MTSCYRGMRWLKCDLQMQTPADAQHWAGDRIEAGQEIAAARAFAEACHQQGLDVVGITDHNFLSKDFIPHLKSAFAEIVRESNHRITLFPGFEFEAAGVGRGVHVLCLFDPDSDLARLDAILTECGVGFPRVNSAGCLEKSDKNLKEILRIVQDKYSGIVIMPHATSNDGIFDDDSISEWLQQDQFTNPDLLAIEVPKPVHLMSAGYQRLLRSGTDCQPGWKRVRPIATVMSSDNKKLVEVDGNQRPVPNSIGYRYSWVKMSEPSVESLRQAFLDHESRVVLPESVAEDEHPAHRFRQASIKSISIRNAAFLADQEVHFSPNMNCVIGGRGGGKSTLLEYLRIMFGKDRSEDLDAGTKDRIKRVRDTLSEPEAEIEVLWSSADGAEDRIVWRDGGPVVHGRDLVDPDAFFKSLPVRFYSQQQLNRLTEAEDTGESTRQAQRLLELVDGFARSDLDQLAERERKLKIKLGEAFSNRRSAAEIERASRRLQQEHEELDRQWRARSEIQEDAKRHQLLKREIRYLEGLEGAPGRTFSDVAALAEEVAASHVSFQVEDAIHEDWFSQFDEKVKAAKESLATAIRSAVEQYEETVSGFKSADPLWSGIRGELDQADITFREACAAKGLTTDDVGRLHEISEQRASKQLEIDEAQAEILRLRGGEGDVGSLIQELHQVWLEQFRKRVSAAERANQLAVLSDSGQRFIEVSAEYQKDRRSFFDLWQGFAPSDGRTRLARNWESCGETLLTMFVGQADARSPWQVLEDCLSPEEGSAGPDFGANSQELFQYIQDNLEQWERLRCSRVQDVVDMKLFRADGSTAGSIGEGSLSDGQRNTAALALLLAQEGGPLIIDQPEDELDSNFVFRELIPMVRKVKSKRQLIMATHNANLPVNGDAELVYAFEARNGRGEMLACGGLDQTAVTKAVLDIMEGTEEAFRRRREKYHF